MKRLSAFGVAGVVSLSLLALAGCGGGDGGGAAACGVAPCGGDLVGSWSPTAICVDQAFLMEDFVVEGCPQASVGAVNFVPSGNVTFNADQTYDMTLTLSGTMTFNYPISCFVSGITCADVDLAFKAALISDPSPSVQSVSCAGSSTCACTFVATPATESEGGTYSTSGSSLLTTSTASGAETIDYCVKGTSVTFRDPPGTTPSEVVGFVAEKL